MGVGMVSGLGKMKENILPCDYCEKEEGEYLNSANLLHRKVHGQFFTPKKLARYMAGMIENSGSNGKIRILDPGAGAGMLACAAFEKLADSKCVKSIELDAWEIDAKLQNHLIATLEYAKKWLKSRKISLKFNVINKDFVLHGNGTLDSPSEPKYDIAIGNPPYFKISKNDARVATAREFVHGQPNIYVLFMGVAAKLLKKNGALVFITPRSYASGPYFKAFRKNFFGMVSPEKIHLFDSRKDAFSADSVLQENIILKAVCGKAPNSVIIASSQGIEDLGNPILHEAKLGAVLHSQKDDIILRIPTSSEDDKIIELIDAFGGRLSSLGLAISTGPVVPFRASEYLVNGFEDIAKVSPLIWLKDVEAMQIRWQEVGQKINLKKPPYILKTSNHGLHTKNSTYVLLRRFSSKEQNRRLTAAPLLKDRIHGSTIAIENHLNYIYRKNGVLSREEAVGLATILNSKIFDRYFRICNGNTQVSANEIRTMPFPEIEVIKQIASRIELIKNAGLDDIDQIVSESIMHKQENKLPMLMVNQ